MPSSQTIPSPPAFVFLRNELGNLTPQTRVCLARLIAKHNVSATQAGPIIEEVLSSYNIAIEDCSDFNGCVPERSSAIRALVEIGMAEDVITSVLLSKSIDLLISIDCTTTWWGRKFVAVLFGGIDKTNQPWMKLVDLWEGIDHTAETQVEVIIETLNRLQQYQEQHKTQLWEFKSIVFDNTSENTGWKNGVAARLERKRQQMWQEKHSQEQLSPMIVKGCIDHMANLVTADFKRRLTHALQFWNCSELLKDGKECIIFNYLRRISKRFGRAPWKGEFQGFCAQQQCVSKVSINKCTTTRFVSFPLVARTVSNNQQLFLSWYTIHEAQLTTEDRYNS